MNNSIQWVDLVTLVGVGAIVTGALWKAWGMITQLRGEIQGVRETIQDVRLEMARGYVTTSSLANVEQRLADSIDRLGAKIDRLVEQRSA